MLVSNRLVMRLPTFEDALAFASSLDDEVQEWQGYDGATVSQWKQSFALGVRERRSSRCPLWLGAYDRQDADRFVGIYFAEVARDRTRAELGWWLGPQARGRGLGRESLPLVLGYVHDHLGVGIVVMGTTTTNVRALAQITATGAECVGEAPHLLPNGSVAESRWFEHRAVPRTP
jgi:RimJ/RimL family protein N-acetyltransferase